MGPHVLVGAGPNALGDVEKALAYVWWLITTGRNRVVIHAGSSDGAYPGWARDLFGSRLSRYGSRHGYSVPWTALLKHMLNVGTEAGTESTVGDGDSPR